MKCAYRDSDHKPCNAQALQNDEFCFWHSENEEVIAKRFLAASKGGQNTASYSLDLPDWHYHKVDSLLRLLEICINKTLQGTMPPKVANSLAYLINVTLSTVKEQELEKRLEVIEHVVGIQKDH